MAKLTVIDTFSYRYAQEILRSRFPKEYRDIFSVIEGTSVTRLTRKKKPRVRGGKTTIMTTDQGAINTSMEQEFRRLKWDVHPRILRGGANESSVTASQLAADFRRNKVQIEVQFGNIARWAYDIFKLQVSFSLDLIEVGACIVPMQGFAATIDENLAYFERVRRELPLARNSITLPILVVGVAPAGYEEIRRK